MATTDSPARPSTAGDAPPAAVSPGLNMDPAQLRKDLLKMRQEKEAVERQLADVQHAQQLEALAASGQVVKLKAKSDDLEARLKTLKAQMVEEREKWAAEKVELQNTAETLQQEKESLASIMYQLKRRHTADEESWRKEREKLMEALSRRGITVSSGEVIPVEGAMSPRADLNRVEREHERNKGEWEKERRQFVSEIADLKAELRGAEVARKAAEGEKTRQEAEVAKLKASLQQVSSDHREALQQVDDSRAAKSAAQTGWTGVEKDLLDKLERARGELSAAAASSLEDVARWERERNALMSKANRAEARREEDFESWLKEKARLLRVIEEQNNALSKQASRAATPAPIIQQAPQFTPRDQDAVHQMERQAWARDRAELMDKMRRLEKAALANEGRGAPAHIRPVSPPMTQTQASHSAASARPTPPPQSLPGTYIQRGRSPSAGSELSVVTEGFDDTGRQGFEAARARLVNNLMHTQDSRNETLVAGLREMEELLTQVTAYKESMRSMHREKQLLLARLYEEGKSGSTLWVKEKEELLKNLRDVEARATAAEERAKVAEAKVKELEGALEAARTTHAELATAAKEGSARRDDEDNKYSKAKKQISSLNSKIEELEAQRKAETDTAQKLQDDNATLRQELEEEKKAHKANKRKLQAQEEAAAAPPARKKGCF